ncbi:MAG: ribonuclease HII [Bacillota bacterium]|nr:ribonuclease HII [Bacillota bacterium]
MNRIVFSEINSLSYKDLNDITTSIANEDFNEASYISELIESLKNDARKNVCSLGLRLENRLTKYRAEMNRMRGLYEFDRSFGNYTYVAGIDEVGRGPLAGPIVAAAVVLKNENPLDECMILGLNDSKKISPEKRERLYDIITNNALYYKISQIENTDIDKLGIAYCNNMVFIRACSGLTLKPDLVLSDGYPIRGYAINNKGVVKGDTKSAAIAAASIIAKVYRDKLMEEYSRIYPQYGFEKNAGYGTQEHIDAIRKYGITPIHRKSFLSSLLG